MKFGRFQTIPEPVMSNRRPDSDSDVARKLCSIQEKLEILKDGDGTVLQDHVDTVRKKLKRELNAVLREHDLQQDAYQEWLDAGQPEID